MEISMDFDMNNLMGMMGTFQKKMEEAKTNAAKIRCTGEAAGGLVKVELSGTYDVVSVQIREEALEDHELLEDLVRAAIGEALRNVKTETGNQLRGLTGGLPLPPGLMPF
jgi:DNA-binding YbaB/EbfC family protein